VKVLAAKLAWSLTLEKAAWLDCLITKNRPEIGLQRADRFIHHVQWEHPWGSLFTVCCYKLIISPKVAMSQKSHAIDNGNAGQSALDPSTLATYLAHLQRMADYITKQEADARGWFTDTDKLKVAEAALQESKEAVQHLAGF